MKNKGYRPQPSASARIGVGRSILATMVTAAVAFVGAFLAAGQVDAAEYYVSPTGSDSNNGSQSSPFATLAKGNSAAGAGDTVWLRGGTYYLTSQVTLSKSGTSDSNRTKFWAYPGEVPVFDCSRYATTNTAADVPVILVTGSYMHLKGFEVANAKVGASGDHSYSLVRTKGSSNNTFELLNLHHGFGPGLFIDTGNGGNLILNCDSHDNYDKDGSQGDGQNGDGFGVHYQTSGPSTIIRGCRAWVDSDDGYDLIYQEVPVIVENSWASQNGYANGGSTSPSSGNGNGFKMGSSGTGIRHIVRNNVAWKNKAAGFYANHSFGGNTWYNNTSYNNGTQYNMLASSFESDGRTIATAVITLTGSKMHIMRNNVGFPDKNSNFNNSVDGANNTWDLGISETSADFSSTSDAGCTGPREADGGMPAACSFMKLKSGSPLIDKGVDVGLAFVGAAPDLGAYEFGANPGSGGATGTGGATGSGGATGTEGVTGAGGAGATGGASASGGAIATGGVMGNGGSTSRDAGPAATGGSAGATGGGGSSGAGSGGTTTPGSGGTVGAGGSTGPGGTPASSGGAGASSASGGSAGTGGAVASGSGGTSGAAVAGAGGSASGGQSGTSTSGGTGATGCSCAIGAVATHLPAGSLVAVLGLLGLALGRRHRR